MKTINDNAAPESSSGATTLPMTPQDELDLTGSNPFEIGHKRGREKDSVYTRFLRDTASSAGKSGAGSNRGSKD